MAKSLANFTQRQRGIVEQGWVPGLEPLRSPEPPWAVTLLSRHPNGSSLFTSCVMTSDVHLVARCYPRSSRLAPPSGPPCLLQASLAEDQLTAEKPGAQLDAPDHPMATVRST